MAVFCWLTLLILPAILAALLLDSLWKAWAFVHLEEIRITPVPAGVHFRQRFLRLYRWRGFVFLLLIVLGFFSQVRVTVDGVARPVPLWMFAAQGTLLPGCFITIIGSALLAAGVLLPRQTSWGFLVGWGTAVSTLLPIGLIATLAVALPDNWHSVSHRYETIDAAGNTVSAGGVSTTLIPLYTALILLPLGLIVFLQRTRAALDQLK